MSETTFRALVVVVPHYRIISLNRPDGEVEILAVDPTETQPDRRRADAAHAAPRARGLGAAREGDGRAGALRRRDRFCSTARRVKDGGAVIVASDAAMFLAAGSWPSQPVARLFVTDPGGVVWADCATPGGCSATDSETVTKYFQAAAPVAGRSPPKRRRSWAWRAYRRCRSSEPVAAADRELGGHLGRVVARDHGTRGAGCCRAW